MLTKQLPLSVRQDFTIPHVYSSGSVEEVEEALWIGATIQESVRNRRANDEIRKLGSAKDAEIARIQSDYSQKIGKLLDDLRLVTLEKERVEAGMLNSMKDARGLERDCANREWEEKLRVVRREHEILSGRYEALEARRIELEESRKRDIDDTVRRSEEMMEKVVAAKQEQLLKMEGAYQRLQEVISKQTEEIGRLGATVMKRGANVKIKGSDYEEEFREKLIRVYGLCGGFSLRDTRLGMGHEMDFSMEMEGHIVLWELKNYGNQVPKGEVDKFLRDLKENPQARIGVMISRSTDIYGKCGSGLMMTEFDDGKMMIYVSRFEEFCGGDETKIFQMLGGLFRIWWQYGAEGNTEYNREELIRELEKVLEELSRRRTEWRRHKAHLDEIGRWTTDLLEESENRLDRILKKVRAVPEKESSVEIPDGVFREMEGEKESGWILSIMKVCECGGQIEVRELVELLSSHYKLSKDTIRSNIMSVIRDSAVVKKGVIKYITGISKRVGECKIIFK